jgi:hypothetical protein
MYVMLPASSFALAIALASSTEKIGWSTVKVSDLPRSPEAETAFDEPSGEFSALASPTISCFFCGSQPRTVTF